MFSTHSDHVYRRQIPGFIVAGGLSTLLHWASMTLLINLSLHPVLATAIGSFVGAACNYLLQRKIAFPQAGAHRQTIWRYLLSGVFAWLSNLAIFVSLLNFIFVDIWFAQVLTSCLVALMNFFLYQRLVFHEQTR